MKWRVRKRRYLGDPVRSTSPGTFTAYYMSRPWIVESPYATVSFHPSWQSAMAHARRFRP